MADYQVDWWNRDQPRVPSDIAELKYVKTIRSHLEMHREACKAIPRPETGRPTPAERPPLPSEARNGLTCTRCKEYHDLAVDSMNRLEATQAMFRTMAGECDTWHRKAMRAASGFYTLYQAAHTKEMCNEGAINHLSPSFLNLIIMHIRSIGKHSGNNVPFDNSTVGNSTISNHCTYNF